jgi:hypothetical protein
MISFITTLPCTTSFDVMVYGCTLLWFLSTARAHPKGDRLMMFTYIVYPFHITIETQMWYSVKDVQMSSMRKEIPKSWEASFQQKITYRGYE